MTPTSLAREFEEEFLLAGEVRREVVSHFPRYGRFVGSLPRGERVKIDRIARFVADGLRSGQDAIRTIRLTGHADLDTPRRPAFEFQIALKRARAVLDAMWHALDRLDRGPGGPPVPPYSSRVAWEVHSAGANRLVVPSPRMESERSRNRRVEISLIPYSGLGRSIVPAKSARSGLGSGSTIDVGAAAAIEDFLRRAPNDKHHFKDKYGIVRPDRRICVQAVASKAMQLCDSASSADRDVDCGPPLTRKGGRCNSSTAGASILAKPDYRSPLTGPIRVRCCGVSNPCPPSTLSTLPRGQYLVLQYKPQPLAQMVDKIKCLLRRGCTVPVGVLSGICDDKPDQSDICKPVPLKNKWRDCWEHWLLVIGFDGDRFVFWDSAQTSIMGPIRRDRDNHWFGFLFYDSNNHTLSTANPDPHVQDALEVDWHGFHTQGVPYFDPDDPEHPDQPGQKRYQVVSMWPGLPWKADAGPCKS